MDWFGPSEHPRAGWHRSRVALVILLFAAGQAGQPVYAWGLPKVTAAEAPSSRFLPPPNEIALPSEQAVLSDLAIGVSGGDPFDSAAILASLDAALAKLREPTKLRGYVQFLRSNALLAEGKHLAGVEAIEESIRLLPEYSGPLIMAAHVYAYSNRPGEGADYLLRASRKDPGIVQMVDDYEINNLIARLAAAGDERRVRLVSDRLLELGWIGTGLGSASALARDAIKRRIASGDIAGARSLVPKLLVPSDAQNLLITNAYMSVWPDIEKWAGPRLERLWSIYLAEARERWKASKDVSAVRDYANALVLAGHDQTLIRDILPLLSEKIDQRRDHDLVFVAPRVATALAYLGRWQEVDALFDRAQRTWPLGSHANALNIAANRAKYLLYAGRYSEALDKMDAAIADARKWGPGVNTDALALMYHYKACMLHELGRDSEGGVFIAAASFVESPANVAHLHLCVGKPDRALKALMNGLKHEAKRESVIAFVQMPDERFDQSDYGRAMRARFDALRSNPRLHSEVARYGRVLPYSLNDGAPQESR